MSSKVVEDLAKLLYKIAEQERKVELSRQALVSLREFNSALAFKKLDAEKRNKISISQFQDFFKTNKVAITGTELEYLFRVIDRKKDGFIDWEEFCTVFTSKNCSFHQTSNLQYDSPSKMAKTVEEKMAYVLITELQQIKNIEVSKNELYNNQYFHIQKTFNLIDIGKKGWIDLRDLFDFMKSELGNVTYEIAERVLRRIDTLEDKKIDFSEWVEALTPLRNLLNKELNSFDPISYIGNRGDLQPQESPKYVEERRVTKGGGTIIVRRLERNLCQPLASYTQNIESLSKITPSRRTLNNKPSRTHSRKVSNSRSKSKSKSKSRSDLRKKKRRKKRRKRKKNKASSSSSGSSRSSNEESRSRSHKRRRKEAVAFYSNNNKENEQVNTRTINGGGDVIVIDRRRSTMATVNKKNQKEAKNDIIYEESRVIKHKNLKESFLGGTQFQRTIKFSNNPEVVPDPIPVQKILLDNEKKMVISETVLKDITKELNIKYKEVGEEILTPRRALINGMKKEKNNYSNNYSYAMSRSLSKSRSKSRSISGYNKKESNKIIDSINLTAKTLEKKDVDFLPTTRKLKYISNSKDHDKENNTLFLNEISANKIKIDNNSNDCLIKIDTPDKYLKLFEQNKPNLRFDSPGSPINIIMNTSSKKPLEEIKRLGKSPSETYSPVIIRRLEDSKRKASSVKKLTSNSPPSPVTPHSSRTMTSDKTIFSEKDNILRELNFVSAEKPKDISTSLSTLVQNFRLVQSKKYSLNQIGRFTPLGLFKYLDSDSTGYLTVEKLYHFLSAMNPKFYLEDISIMVKRHDLDGDNMLSYKEFFLMLTPYDAFYREDYRKDEERIKSGNYPACRGLDREILRSLSDLFHCLLITEKNDDIMRDVIGPYFYDQILEFSNGSGAISKEDLENFFYKNKVVTKHRELDGLIPRYNLTFGGKLRIEERSSRYSINPVVRYSGVRHSGRHSFTLKSNDFDISRSDPLMMESLSRKV